MVWELEKGKFQYLLRYYLVEQPKYDRATAERRVAEMIDYCKENKIEAVMFYVDSDPYYTSVPDSVEHTLQIKDIIAYAGRKLREAGMSYQLNFQNLFGANDGNCDHTSHMDIECYVDEFGEESKGASACFLGEKFRKMASEKLHIWASTEPDVIWVDDDFRFHNRLAVTLSGINQDIFDFGCFCERHMAAFNKRYNCNFDRETLHKAILEKGGGSEMGKKWRQFCGECYVETASWVEKTVHEVSPDTRVAIMSSMPDCHAQEGRNWGTFLKALSGDHIPLVRPHYGPYCDAQYSPRVYTLTHLYSEQLETNIAAQYDGEVDYAPELENWHFTQYAKSVAATSFQLMLSAFQGYKGITLSITDLEGCSFLDEKVFGKLLKERKDYCVTMANMLPTTLKTKGVALITSPTRYPDAEKEEADAIGRYMPQRQLDSFFEKIGVPCQYVLPEEAPNCDLVILDSDAVIQLNDDELKGCLAKGIFADAGAAKVIGERGFGEYIGVIAGERASSTSVCELIRPKKHYDGSDRYLVARIPTGDWRMLTLNGATELTTLSTPDARMFPGLTSFENSLGGKVYVYAADGGFSDKICTTYRIELIRDIIEELAPGVVRAEFPSFALMAVKEDENNTAVFVSNFAADEIKDIPVKFPKEPKKVEMVTADGKVQEIAVSGRNTVIPCGLHMYESVVLLAHY